MTFIEGMEVIYQNMSGSISFVGNSYVVIAIPTITNSQYAKLLVYHENYSDIQVISK